MKIVTLKVKDEYYEIAEKMVEMGIAKSRNEAFNIIISYGVDKAKEELEKKKKIKELTEKWLKEGLPFELPTSEYLLREREWDIISILALILALINEKDPNHEKALAKEGEKVISKLVVTELYSVFSHTLKMRSLMPL